MPYVSDISISASHGQINKLFQSAEIAAVYGPINKKVVEIQIAPVYGPINKSVLLGGLLGDVNGDGEVDILDYTYVRLYVEQGQPLTAEQLNRADVNRDGVVDATDQALIQAMVLG